MTFCLSWTRQSSTLFITNLSTTRFATLNRSHAKPALRHYLLQGRFKSTSSIMDKFHASAANDFLDYVNASPTRECFLRSVIVTRELEG